MYVPLPDKAELTGGFLATTFRGVECFLDLNLRHAVVRGRFLLFRGIGVLKARANLLEMKLSSSSPWSFSR